MSATSWLPHCYLFTDTNRILSDRGIPNQRKARLLRTDQSLSAATEFPRHLKLLAF